MKCRLSFANWTREDEAWQILEAMRVKLSKEFGVTLIGNRVTVRWNNADGELVDVHMIVESVYTPSEAQANRERMARLTALVEKYAKRCPELRGELYYAENGEWSK